MAPPVQPNGNRILPLLAGFVGGFSPPLVLNYLPLAVGADARHLGIQPAAPQRSATVINVKSCDRAPSGENSYLVLTMTSADGAPPGTQFYG
jgi:hypothetical protein